MAISPNTPPATPTTNSDNTESTALASNTQAIQNSSETPQTRFQAMMNIGQPVIDNMPKIPHRLALSIQKLEKQIKDLVKRHAELPLDDEEERQEQAAFIEEMKRELAALQQKTTSFK